MGMLLAAPASPPSLMALEMDCPDKPGNDVMET
jgi:hypothetical protein